MLKYTSSIVVYAEDTFSAWTIRRRVIRRSCCTNLRTDRCHSLGCSRCAKVLLKSQFLQKDTSQCESPLERQVRPDCCHLSSPRLRRVEMGRLRVGYSHLQDEGSEYEYTQNGGFSRFRHRQEFVRQDARSEYLG